MLGGVHVQAEYTRRRREKMTKACREQYKKDKNKAKLKECLKDIL